jgi:hypothetical protein
MSVFLFCFVDEPFFVAIVVSFARFRFMESKIEKQGHFFFCCCNRVSFARFTVYGSKREKR